MQSFTESIVEDAALAWLASLGYAVLHGPDIAAVPAGRQAGEPGAEPACACTLADRRSDPSYRDVLLERREMAAEKFIGRMA